jgi:hypothetical protein
MGVLIVAQDTLAAPTSKIISPVQRGLEGYFTFDTDASRFAVNRAPGKPNAAVVGTPVAFATHGRFKGNANFLQTQIAEVANMTLIVVGKAVSAVPDGSSGSGDANTPMYAGNFRSTVVTPGYTGVAGGVAMGHVSSTTMTGFGGRDNGSGALSSGIITLAAEAPTTWAIRAIRARQNGATTIQNVTTGTRSDSASTTLRTLNDLKMRIGSGGGSSGFAGEVDVSMAIFASVTWTDAELALVVEQIRARMTRLGITV